MKVPLATVPLETVEIDTSDDPLWYRDAVIYQLNVKAFFDSDNDGMGDFKGVTAKLDYVKDLGVDGFRLDAIPYLIERDGTSNENLPETHEVIKKLRAAQPVELDLAAYKGRVASLLALTAFRVIRRPARTRVLMSGRAGNRGRRGGARGGT